MSKLRAVPTPVATVLLAALLLGLGGLSPAPAADHADTPFLATIGRHDARLTDLFAFPRNGNLVLILDSNPAIPASATSYRFPSDLAFRIFLDVDAEVAGGEEAERGRDRKSIRAKEAVAVPGGVLLEPQKIQEELTFVVTFDADGAPRVDVKARRGMKARAIQDALRVYAGLRDDPFIRAPRTGRNVAGLVLEVPLELVRDDQDTLLVWAISEIRGVRSEDGQTMDMAAQPLRSQFPENMDTNFFTPRDQWKKLGVAPDVLVLDTSRPAGWPNGRVLTDDVVDLVGDPRLLADDAPFPSENDVPFLPDFPYLGEPHVP